MRKSLAVLMVCAFLIGGVGLLLAIPELADQPASGHGNVSYTVKCGNAGRGCTATTTIYGDGQDWAFTQRAAALEGWMCQKCR